VENTTRQGGNKKDAYIIAHGGYAAYPFAKLKIICLRNTRECGIIEAKRGKAQMALNCHGYHTVLPEPELESRPATDGGIECVCPRNRLEHPVPVQQA
jgi:hypothetical protein